MVYKIYQDGEYINIIESDEVFVKQYCAENGYTYEFEERAEPESPIPPPTLQERVASLENAIERGLSL